MTFQNVICTAVVLFFGTTIAAYGQKEGKEEPQQHAAQPEQHAQPAKAPAQQSQQHAQQAKAPAEQPQQRAQQAKAPAEQPQQHAQQSKAPAQQPQQRAPQAKAPAEQPQQRAQQAKAPAQQPQQHAQQSKAPAEQPQQHAQQAKAPAPQSQQHAQQTNQQQPQRTPQQAQSWQQNRGWAKQGGSWQPHTSFQQGRDQNWASDHRDWAQRGGYGGSYIPQASFGLYFGSQHFFHIGMLPVMYMGYPRFAYEGFSFLVVDPWPASWQENWYASDDVYIDYDGGYYLHDRRYPGVTLAITVI